MKTQTFKYLKNLYWLLPSILLQFLLDNELESCWRDKSTAYTDEKFLCRVFKMHSVFGNLCKNFFLLKLLQFKLLLHGYWILMCFFMILCIKRVKLTGTRFFVTAETVTDELDGACQALAKRLEVELRAAKHAQLACGEVLLPADLLPRIAKDVLKMAENEPCGLR